MGEKGPKPAIPEQFLRQTKPLAEAEKQGGSAVASSVDEAKKALDEHNIRYPALVIPEGAAGHGEDFHVVNNAVELEEAVGEALSVSVGRKVHIVSRYPEKLESGRRSSSTLR